MQLKFVNKADPGAESLQGEHGRSVAPAGLGGSREPQHVGKTGRVENRGGLIPDFLHQKADATGLFVAAIIAFLICSLAGAWQRCEWPFKHPDYMAHRDLIGRFAQTIAAAFAFFTAENSVILQLQQYQLKEPFGDVAALGNFRDQQGTAAVFFTHDEQRLERIFGLM